MYQTPSKFNFIFVIYFIIFRISYYYSSTRHWRGKIQIFTNISMCREKPFSKISHLHDGAKQFILYQVMYFYTIKGFKGFYEF